MWKLVLLQKRDNTLWLILSGKQKRCQTGSGVTCSDRVRGHLSRSIRSVAVSVFLLMTIHRRPPHPFCLSPRSTSGQHFGFRMGALGSPFHIQTALKQTHPEPANRQVASSDHPSTGLTKEERHLSVHTSRSPLGLMSFERIEPIESTLAFICYVHIDPWLVLPLIFHWLSPVTLARWHDFSSRIN